MHARHRYSQITQSILLLFICCILFGCATHDINNIDTTDISQLKQARNKQRSASATKTELSPLRAKALQDSAMSIGAQGGLAWASQRMNSNMEKDDKYLNSIFNFGAMMLSHGVLPPVLEEGDNSLNLSDPNTIRVADRTYKIVQQARFATTPPNWREYLWMSYSKPTLPDNTLLPRNKDEQKVWREGVDAGWEKGIAQSYSIFQQNLARLKRDYRGMLLYRKLLQQKMISPPFVARTELGVTGDGSDMRINDQVLRIVELPKLQTNGSHWKAVVIKAHD
ncbi:MAG TPA: type IV secretion system DotC family protein [Gammaproteobacteria bacterium]|jgi:defect-in-organelle-trafficking protein DotC|nr:type IV secretion system DotC family protein [Gammaproteobacteria bacterium]